MLAAAVVVVRAGGNSDRVEEDPLISLTGRGTTWRQQKASWWPSLETNNLWWALRKAPASTTSRKLSRQNSCIATNEMSEKIHQANRYLQTMPSTPILRSVQKMWYQ